MYQLTPQKIKNYIVKKRILRSIAIVSIHVKFKPTNMSLITSNKLTL